MVHFFLVTFVLSVLYISILQGLNKNIDEVVKDRYQKVKLADTLRYEVSNINSILKEITLELDSERNKENYAQIEKSRKIAIAALNELDELELAPHMRELVIQVKELFTAYNRIEANIIELSGNGRREEATGLLLNEGRTVRLVLFGAIEDLISYQETTMDEIVLNSEQEYHKARNITISFALGGFFLGALIVGWIITNIYGRITKITSALSQMPLTASDDKMPKINISSRDEFGEIALAFNQMSASLEEHSKQEKAYLEAMQEHSLLKTRMAEISNLQQGVLNLKDLAQILINKITPSVGASHGIFTCWKEKETRVLKELAAYAAERLEDGSRRFQIGEGLVGQCAVESKIIHLTRVTDKHIQITTGIVKLAPKSLILVPVKFENQVLAVIELAPLRILANCNKTCFTNWQTSLV
ncbi:hypothetical protein N752_14965 [Desulforamulus aquiferis]|nr:MCP four helix bundle domain-containing protein [Desulforamulus aquiferis]RYD04671.1 hypothetical protein N752_14965 [Desulforamulus aquiferis]